MGLAQRRIMAELKDSKYPKAKERLDAAAGFPVPLEPMWDTLPRDDYENPEMYFECFEKVYITPLETVIKSICADDMGKSAFKEGMKKIILDGTDGSNPNNTTFEAGVLTIKHKMFTNVDDIKERVKVWQKLIESKL